MVASTIDGGTDIAYEQLDTTPIAHGIAVRERERRELSWWDPHLFLSIAYVAAVGLLCAAMLFAFSVPGMVTIVFWAAMVALFWCGVIWLVLAALCAFGKRPDRQQRMVLTLVATAAIVIVTVVAILVSVPLRARFELARGDFDAVAEQFEREGPSFIESNPGPGEYMSVGTFEIHVSDVRQGALVLYERNGAFFDDAGFVYAPDGRLPGSAGDFESPDYVPLGGGWYAFTASW